MAGGDGYNGRTALERAFELARNGKVASVDDIRQTLKGEGYSLAQIAGRELTRQLRTLIKAATPDPVRQVGDDHV